MMEMKKIEYPEQKIVKRFEIIWNWLNNFAYVEYFQNGDEVIINGKQYKFNQFNETISIISRNNDTIFLVSDDQDKSIFTKKELIKNIKNKNLHIKEVVLKKQDQSYEPKA
jgi:hypothetical protein